MKSNLKLNTLTSLQSVEAMARKNAALADIARKNSNAKPESDSRARNNRPAAASAAKGSGKSPKPSKGKGSSQTNIDMEIRSIFLTLSTNSPEGQKVVMQQPTKGSYCKGLILIYRQADLLRQQEEEEAARELQRQGIDKKDAPKPFKATPIVKYAFYPGNLDPTKLGSIAIYGNDASSFLALIRKSGSLFGHTVIEAKLEMGIRPFVDVTLRPIK